MNRIELILQMLNDDPHDPFLHYGLAMEYLAIQDNAKALEKFQFVYDNFPHYLPVYYQLGKCLEASLQHQQAENIYRQGVDLAKQLNEPKTLNELNEALFLLSDE